MFIRKIQPGDNIPLAKVIKTIMSEFEVDHSATIVGDPALHTMFQNYQDPRSVYYVVEQGSSIVGGAGISRLPGGAEEICELQRMFLLKESRGRGLGQQLMMLCISRAREFGYKKMYLETLSQMDQARILYERFGFKKIPGALGRTGHNACDVFMTLDL